MNKVKVRCSVCGKSFKTPSLKKTVCPSCDADLKKARHQSAPVPVQPAVARSSGIDVRAALRAASENQGQFGAYKPPAPPPPAPPPVHTVPSNGQVTRPGLAVRSGAAGATRPAHVSDGKPKPPRADARLRAPRPRREKKPRVQTKPFEPTAEQIAAIKARYLELAQPEFDGIRHQIATETGVPLRAVKQLINEVRAEQHVQSWWERNAAPPSTEQIEQVRELYLPLLPEPEIGVHKLIAAQLKLTNTSVYQAIGVIRSELELPKYNERPELSPIGADDESVSLDEEQQQPTFAGE